MYRPPNKYVGVGLDPEFLLVIVLIFCIPLFYFVGSFVNARFMGRRSELECTLLLPTTITQIKELYDYPLLDSAKPIFRGYQFEYSFLLEGKVQKRKVLFNAEKELEMINELEENEGKNLRVCYNPNYLTKAHLVIAD